MTSIHIDPEQPTIWFPRKSPQPHAPLDQQAAPPPAAAAEVEAAAAAETPFAAAAGEAAAAQGEPEERMPSPGPPSGPTTSDGEGAYVDATSTPLAPSSTVASGSTAFADATSHWDSGDLPPAASGGLPLAGPPPQQGSAAIVQVGQPAGEVAEEPHYGGPGDKSAAGETGTGSAIQTAINIEAGVAAVLGSGPALPSGEVSAGASGFAEEPGPKGPTELESLRSGGGSKEGRPPGALGDADGEAAGGSAEGGGGLGLPRQLTLQYPGEPPKAGKDSRLAGVCAG